MIDYFTTRVSIRKGPDVINIDLHSHFTCILSLFSGDGKSEFLSFLSMGIADGSLEFESDYAVNIADAASILGILGNPERQIIFMDEMCMLRDDFINLINESKHIFIGITRAFPLKLDCPLTGIYKAFRTQDWFDIESLADSLPVATNFDSSYRIITEATENRSEHAVLSHFIPNVDAAAGRDKIERLLRNSSGNIIVFADLANIGRSFKVLCKRCEQNPNIRFYDYNSFEELLSYTKPLADTEIVGEEVLDFLTAERFFENYVERVTENTAYQYKHGGILSENWFTFSIADLFCNEVGMGIYNYLTQNNTANEATPDTDCVPQLSAFSRNSLGKQ